MPSLSMLSVRGVAVLLTLFMTSTTIEVRPFDPNRRPMHPILELCGAMNVSSALSSELRLEQARSCQIRNFAGEPVDFYWMDVGNWVSVLGTFGVKLLTRS